MKNTILMLALCLSFAVVITSCKGEEKEGKHVEGTEMHENEAADAADIAMNYAYQCPMDCEEGKTYDEEGTCPKCKMALKKIKKDTDEGHNEDHDKNSEHDNDGDKEHADESSEH